MEKEFVTYEQALALKELGFEQGTFTYYSKEDYPNSDIELNFNYRDFYPEEDYIICAAPLKQQVFRWFREKKCISQILYDNFHNSYDYQIDGKNHIYDGCFITYEEAENACIDKLIELVKNK